MENPYLSARAETANRTQARLREIRAWQMCALSSLTLNVLFLASLLWAINRSSAMPYIVEVDKSGTATAVRPADKDVARKPEDFLIRAHLAAIIRNSRVVIRDPVALKTQIDLVYQSVVPPAIKEFEEYWRGHDPFVRCRSEQVAVDIHSLLKISDHTWQVRWTETTSDFSGHEISRELWTAQLTLELHSPMTEAGRLANPLGIYVVGLTASKNISPEPHS